MSSCVRNILAKNYSNLVICFQVTSFKFQVTCRGCFFGGQSRL